MSDLSPAQVAAQTGLSRTLIYREIDRGNLAAYKVGERLRVTPEALAEWKAAHTVEPRPTPAYEPPRRRPRGRFASDLRAIRGGNTA